jgi:tellurite resistance protein TerC
MTTGDRTRRAAATALRHARRLAILVIGLTVVAIGTAMIVLPGPAVVVIPIGLAILATEFVWARRLLDNLKDRGRDLVGKRRRSDGAS